MHARVGNEQNPKSQALLHASENRSGQLAYIPHHTDPTQFALDPRGFTAQN